MVFLPTIEATPNKIRMDSNNYIFLTEILGMPQQETKDIEGTVVSVFGIEVDMNLFKLRFPRNNLHKVCELAVAILNKKSIILFKAWMMTRFLSFCAKVVRLD